MLPAQMISGATVVNLSLALTGIGHAHLQPPDAALKFCPSSCLASLLRAGTRPGTYPDYTTVALRGDFVTPGGPRRTTEARAILKASAWEKRSRSKFFLGIDALRGWAHMAQTEPDLRRTSYGPYRS